MDTLIVLITLVELILLGKILVNVTRQSSSSVGKGLETLVWIVLSAASLFPAMMTLTFMEGLSHPAGYKWAGVAAMAVICASFLGVKYLIKLIFSSNKV